MKTSKLKYRIDPETGCWLMRAQKYHGYATVRIGSRTDGTRRLIGAHRYSYEIHIGPIPEGLCVCHTCDVRNCVNPDHLFVGTHQDNMTDKKKKGRVPPQDGESNPNAKLSAQAVESIRREYIPHKVTTAELAAKYGVTSTMISLIVRRKRWNDGV